jgi:hypothetical protein
MRLQEGTEVDQAAAEPATGVWRVCQGPVAPPEAVSQADPHYAEQEELAVKAEILVAVIHAVELQIAEVEVVNVFVEQRHIVDVVGDMLAPICKVVDSARMGVMVRMIACFQSLSSALPFVARFRPCVN